MTHPGATAIKRISWRTAEGAVTGERMTAEEAAVAIIHDGTTTAVMMATPDDLEDFALGFSLSEGHRGTARRCARSGDRTRANSASR